MDKGQIARVEVTVKADGLPSGSELPVTLERPGGSPIRKVVRVQAGGGRPVVSFVVPMEEAGEVELAVAVGPADRDVRPDNDRRTLKVTVTDDTARVLAIDGEARWEFQYLRNALMRDPRVEFEGIVFRQPKGPGGTVYPTALPPRPDPSGDPDAPRPPDPLGAFDLIVLGDVGPDDLDADAWARLDRYVAERGGTLVVSVGPKHWPSVPAAIETLGDLLPVRNVRLVPVDRPAPGTSRPALPAGVAIVPTASAISGPWPMLQFADEPARVPATWAELPPLPWVLAGTPKPSATVLATAGGTEAGEAGDDQATIAALPYGLGKVLWVGTDGTWRWRYRVGDLYHHRFWGQVAQWATRGKLEAGNRLVQFGAVPPRVVEGDTATIRARFTEDAPGVGPGLIVAARVFKAAGTAANMTDGPMADGPGSDVPMADGRGSDGPMADGRSERTASGTAGRSAVGEAVAVVPLRAAVDQPRVFEGTAPRLPPGEYVVRLDAPALAEVMEAEGGMPEAGLTVAVRETSERVELAASRDELDALAAATGGRVLTDYGIEALPGLLDARRVVRTRVESSRLWDRPEWLLAFFGLLTGEWVLRKRAGLP